MSDSWHCSGTAALQCHVQLTVLYNAMYFKVLSLLLSSAQVHLLSDLLVESVSLNTCTCSTTEL